MAGSPSATWLRITREVASDIDAEDTSHMSLLIAVLLAWFVLPSPWGVIVVIGAIGLEVVEITWGLRLARRRSSVGVQALVGKHAEAATDLDPVGPGAVAGRALARAVDARSRDRHHRRGARRQRPRALGRAGGREATDTPRYI